jgi:hypothetical protein
MKSIAAASSSTELTLVYVRTLVKLDFKAYQNEAKLTADNSESLEISGGYIIRRMYQQDRGTTVAYPELCRLWCKQTVNGLSRKQHECASEVVRIQMTRLRSLSSGEEPKLPEDEACGLVLAGA